MGNIKPHDQIDPRYRTATTKRLRKAKAKRHAAKSGTAKSTARTKRSAFYQSEEWLSVRYKALKRWGARCQCCGATRQNGVRIHVDHIKPRSRYPKLALVLSNLQVLCEPCNLGKRARDETDWRTETERDLDGVDWSQF